MYNVMTIDNTIKRVDTESSHNKSSFSFLFYFFNFILFLNFTILYWFCHISK